jgi:hypothetical protein
VLLHVNAEQLGDNVTEPQPLYFSNAFEDSHFQLYIDGAAVDLSALLAADNVSTISDAGVTTNSSSSQPAVASIGARIGTAQWDAIPNDVWTHVHLEHRGRGFSCLAVTLMALHNTQDMRRPFYAMRGALGEVALWSRKLTLQELRPVALGAARCVRNNLGTQRVEALKTHSA